MKKSTSKINEQKKSTESGKKDKVVERAETVKTKKAVLSFVDFHDKLLKEFCDVGGFEKPHHSDYHYIGANNDCSRCDNSLPSINELYQEYLDK